MALLKPTLFSDVYKSFLSKITDDMYMQLDLEDTYAILQQLLLSAIPKFEFPRQSLEYHLVPTEEVDWDSLVVLNWCFVNHLTRQEINILSNYMIVQWIGQQLASVENVRMKYSGSDFKFTSQANHMQKLLQLKKDYERQGFHLQRLYKRRAVDNYGIYRSTFGNIMSTPHYTDTNSISGTVAKENPLMIENLNLIRGDSFSFDISISDLDNIHQVITEITFSVKKTKQSVDYAFQKTLDNGITETDTLKYRIDIAPEDTINLVPGEYIYDIEVKINRAVYTVMMGNILIKEDITTN